MCKLIGKCAGIRKRHPNFAKVKKARDDSKNKLSNKYKDLLVLVNRLINQDAISETLQEKIDALKAAFNALVSKKRLLPTELEEAEKILFQLRRVYVTQKAAHDKNLKEKEAAALAKCAADDFVPTRSD
jgi:predicted nuclease with TOPRIM domain